MALDPQDELGLPWDAMADGRVHRLIRGRDFVRGADAVEEAAGNAARRLGRVVRTFKETRWGIVYFWVQFVDHVVVIGEPCPCGSTELQQVNLYFAECASCGATVALVKLKRERPVDEDAFAEDEPLLQALFAAGPAPPRKATSRAKAKAAREEASLRDPRTDLTRLGAYSHVNLYWSATAKSRERLVGHALGPLERPYLLVVDFALAGGERVPDPEYPGGWMHMVWSVPTGPFGSLIRLEGFGNRMPALQIEDPSLEREAPPPRAGWSPEPMTPPPDRLSAFEDVTLVPHRTQEGKQGPRFRGHGRLPGGETVLMTVRYLERGRGEVPVPGPTDDAPHTVRCVPVAPFVDVVDTRALLEAEEPAAASEPRNELTTLAAFKQLDLFLDGKGERWERLYGRGIGFGDQDCLVVVDFPLFQGARIADATYPAGCRHTAWSVPLAPFGTLIRLDSLDKQDPYLRIDDPLTVELPSAPTADAQSAEPPTPPSDLSALEDVRLFRYGGGPEKKRESFLGFGRTPAGEMLLLRVRYSGRGEDRKQDLRSIPLGPVEDLVDTEAILSRDPDGAEPEAGNRRSIPAEREASAGATSKRRRRETGARQSGRPQAAELEADAATDEPKGTAPAGEPEAKTLADETEATATADKPEVKAVVAAATAAPPPAEPEPPDSKPEPTELGGFSQLRLFRYGRDEGRESFYGHGRTRDGRLCLVVAEHALGDGGRGRGSVQTVRWLPIDPFGRLIDLDALRSLEPVVEIGREVERVMGELPPAESLAGFRDLHLFVSQHGNGERFYGYGRTSAGETALLTVRDPMGGNLERSVQWIPLAPFIPLVDLDALFSATPDLLVDAPGAEVSFDRPA